MRHMAILLLLTAGLTLLGFAPFPRHEVSQMRPAELLCLQESDGGVLVRTEDDLTAWGQTQSRALERLVATAPGELFLATVENMVFLGVSPEAEELLAIGIRPGTAVYAASDIADAKTLNEYLKAHPGGVTLGALREHPHTSLPGIYGKEQPA